jgi:UDP-glucose 4-epimerase
MRFFITGAKGRLGRCLCSHFIASGNAALGFSRNADASHLPLAQLPYYMEQGADALFHLAWSSVPSTSELTPGIEWREDLPLLSQILSELLKIQSSGRTPPLFVFFSSCSVYGDSDGIGRFFSESDPKIPKGWYARGKAEAENLLEGFQTLGLPILILRITNPYGFPQRQGAMQGVIPAIFHAVTESRAIDLWGDGSATKDFIHISDLLRAIDLLVASRETGIFNIASSQPVSINALVSRIEDQLGQVISKNYRPPGEWDVQKGCYSNNRLSVVTGWKPKISIEEGIKIYAQQFFADFKG